MRRGRRSYRPAPATAFAGAGEEDRRPRWRRRTLGSRPRQARAEPHAGPGQLIVGRGDVRGYAREIAHLVNGLGADHVGIGTDIEGVGTSWSVNDYSHVRSVVDALQDLKLPPSAIEQVAGGNYARVLKAALKG